jgi:hypothetical protein
MSAKEGASAPSCKLEDLRFDAELLLSVRVDSMGAPNNEELTNQIAEGLNEWQPAAEPYFCLGCNQAFRRWETAKAHTADGQAEGDDGHR